MSEIRSMSRKEAERILAYDMIHKEFWVLNDQNDNFGVLTDVLDILYNDECKTYSADIVDNQNYSRLVIKCTVCNANLSSRDPFLSHNNGKNHKKALQQLSADKTRLHNLMGPIVYKKLSEMENEFEPGCLEDQLFSTSHVVLGWQFLYREKIGEKDLYTCQLCSKGKKDESYRMSQAKAFDHTIHESHLLEYMHVKFQRKGTFDQLFEEIQDIQKMEGKIQCKIMTLRTGKNRETSPFRRSRMEESVDSASLPSTSFTGRERHSSPNTSRRSLTPDRGQHDRKPHGRPKTPPPPEKLEKATQKDIPEQTMAEFMQDISRHYNNMFKRGDDLTEELKKDLEGQDLLIQAVKVLSQKVYLYSMTGNLEEEFQKNACGLLKKTEFLRLVHDES